LIANEGAFCTLSSWEVGLLEDFKNILKKLFKGEETIMIADVKEEEIEKVLSYRSNGDSSYYAVKGKHIVVLGYEEPEDVESGQTEFDGRYALFISRGYDKTELQMLDEGTSTSQAQEKALDLLENNKNEITRISVGLGIPKSFAGRSLFRTVASYAYLGKSEKGFDELTLEELEKATGSTSTQSILFPTSKYTVDQAKTWLKSHGKSSGGVDTTENFHRFRQFDPAQCSSTPKTITMGKGIKAIICVKKSEGENKEVAKDTDIDFEVAIKMADFEKGLVYGIVYSPNTEDSHGDWTTAAEIEKAAHDFLPTAKSDWTNINHGKDELPDVDVVESYIAPCDFVVNKETVSKGSWVIVSRVNNAELRTSIQKGEVTGYSLEGTARKG
jgi:hypothetical protein